MLHPENTKYRRIIINVVRNSLFINRGTQLINGVFTAEPESDTHNSSRYRPCKRH